MKRLLFILLMLPFFGLAQTTYHMRYDTVRIYKQGGTGELILENSTKGLTNGFLKNYGEGRTRFAYALDSVWIDGDSIRFRYGNATIAVLKGGSSVKAWEGLTVDDDTVKLGGTWSSPAPLTTSRAIDLNGQKLFFQKGDTLLDESFSDWNGDRNTPLGAVIIDSVGDTNNPDFDVLPKMGGSWTRIIRWNSTARRMHNRYGWRFKYQYELSDSVRDQGDGGDYQSALISDKVLVPYPGSNTKRLYVSGHGTNSWLNANEGIPSLIGNTRITGNDSAYIYGKGFIKGLGSYIVMDGIKDTVEHFTWLSGSSYIVANNWIKKGYFIRPDVYWNRVDSIFFIYDTVSRSRSYQAGKWMIGKSALGTYALPHTLVVNGGTLLTDTINYHTNVAAKYSARSLVDKNYVDSSIAAGSGSGSFVNVSTADNSVYSGDLSSANAQSSVFLGLNAGHTGSNFSVGIGRGAGEAASTATQGVFLGMYAGRYADTAKNAIFIGPYAGNEEFISNPNRTSNGANDYSILIGRYTSTGGYKNSILLGGNTSTSFISNTAANQFMLAPNITKLRFNSYDYDLGTDTLATRAYARSVGGAGGGSLLPTSGTGTASGNVTGNMGSNDLLITGEGSNVTSISRITNFGGGLFNNSRWSIDGSISKLSNGSTGVGEGSVNIGNTGAWLSAYDSLTGATTEIINGIDDIQFSHPTGKYRFRDLPDSTTASSNYMVVWNSEDSSIRKAPLPTGGSTVSLSKGFMHDTMTVSGVKTIIPRYSWWDDFLGSNSTTIGSVFLAEFSNGTSADASRFGNPGSITGATGDGYGRAFTGTTNTGVAIFQTNSLTNQNEIGLVDYDKYYRVSFKGVIFPTLSDGSETYSVSFGFGQNASVNNSIVVEYTHSENSGAFVCKSHAGTTPETTNTAVTVAANTEYNIDIEFYNGSAKFWINGTLVATHTTSVPADGGAMRSVMARIQKSAGTTAREFYIDAIGLRVTHENDL